MSGIMTNHQGHLVRAGGTADHVHVLLDLKPNLSVAEAMRLLKTNTSKWIHDTFPQDRDFGWQTGYGAFSVSPSNSAAVVAYIDGQEAHHQRQSFQDEFRQLLAKHGLSFVENELWN
jgi:putative transposase